MKNGMKIAGAIFVSTLFCAMGGIFNGNMTVKTAKAQEYTIL